MTAFKMALITVSLLSRSAILTDLLSLNIATPVKCIAELLLTACYFLLLTAFLTACMTTRYIAMKDIVHVTSHCWSLNSQVGSGRYWAGRNTFARG